MKISPPDPELLSLNTATVREKWNLREMIEGCARRGIRGISPWRDKLAELDVKDAARLVRDNGLTVTGLCRGGMFPAADRKGRQAAIDDNLRAIEDAAVLGARCLVLCDTNGGALPHEVDAALTRFGFAMGVFAVHDMAGNDVGYPTRKAQMATRDPSRRWNDLIMKLVEQGRLGQKSGRGWYRYEPGSRTPLRDAELEAFIVAESARIGIERRAIDEDEVLERCLFGAGICRGASLMLPFDTPIEQARL